MDALSSVAVVGQLLGQAINIWQQVDLVRQTIKASPKLLNDLTVQSANLQRILRDIKISQELHTGPICNQIEYIYSISLELQQILKRLAALNRQSLLRQGLHVVGHRARDESRLNDVLSRIEKAKTELLIRMSLVQIEKTGRLSEGLERVESNTRKDQSDFRPTMTVDRNHTEGTADQTSAIAGFDNCQVPIAASITDNTAMNESRQNNLILCGPGSMAVLQALLLEA
ncbi:hypothetical protein G7054_g3008 [Neopestalotiopsis clavispora]|nr:hypothetical protein G7054_g3008 [Neopestalotiopsis clavispora]